MVTFVLPRSQTLEIADCPKRLAVLRSEKEQPRVSFSRTSSTSPERVRQRTDSEERVSRHKSSHRNSWFRSITSSLMSAGGAPRPVSPPSPLDAPTHVRRRTRSLIESKIFTSRPVGAEDRRLPDHMKRPELQLRRIQRRDIPPSKSNPNRSGSVERAQRYPLWWSA